MNAFVFSWLHSSAISKHHLHMQVSSDKHVFLLSQADAVNDMAHALGDDGQNGSELSRSRGRSLPGSLRDRYTNNSQNSIGQGHAQAEQRMNHIRGDSVPTSRIVGFGTTAPVLQRSGGAQNGKSFKERALSKLDKLKHKTQEALAGRANNNNNNNNARSNMSMNGHDTNGLADIDQRAINYAVRRESVSDVVASATSSAELLFELRACLEDTDVEDMAATNDMVAEMIHLCTERRARLAGLAGTEDLSETDLVNVLEAIEKVNGALQSQGNHHSDATTTRGQTLANVTDTAAAGTPVFDDGSAFINLPQNPAGISSGNPFATPANNFSSSSITTRATTTTPTHQRQVSRSDVPQTAEDEEAAIAAAIAASLVLDEGNSPAPEESSRQQQSSEIGNLIDF